MAVQSRVGGSCVREIVLAAAAATALLALAPDRASAASSTDFSWCDGYGLPSGAGDGMTSYAMVLGIFNPPGYGTTDKGSAGFGAQGVMACDAALADTEHLKPIHWMRKVSLLRARALHRLETGDAKGALADLDLARAAVADPDDRYYARSLGLGADFVRAYALRRSGDGPAAVALAVKTAALRPYNRQSPSSALIAMGPAASDKEVEAQMRAYARLNPQVVDDLLRWHLERDRWADVVLDWGQLAPPKTRSRVRLGSVAGYDVERVDHATNEAFWLTRGTVYAYALAALDRPAEARAALQAVRARFEKAVETPPPDPVAKPEVENQRLKLADTNAKLKKEGEAALEQWGRLIELRAQVAEGKLDAVAEDLKLVPLPSSRMTSELKATLARRQAEKAGPSAASPPPPPMVSPAVPAPANDATVSRLFKSLPDAESAKRIAAYKTSSSSIWRMSQDGFKSREGAATAGAEGEDIQSISYRGERTSQTIVEELALLRAADLARQSGKHGFVVLGRQDVRHTISQTYYGTVLRTDPDGYETTLDVVFVDPANLPARFKDAPWRVIDADDVWNSLSPIYVPASETKSESKKR